MSETTTNADALSRIPADDRQRKLRLAQPEVDQSLPNSGMVGDTYTVLLTGKDTSGRFCLIDMFIPPDGGRALFATISRRHS